MVKNRGERAVSLLRKMEWGGVYSYCTGWACCPVCKGIKPGVGKDEFYGNPKWGHHKGCELEEIINET